MRCGVNRWRSVSVCVLLCAVGTGRLAAQTPAGGLTVGGTVFDPAGKPVPNVAVLGKRVGRMWNDNKTLPYTINGVKLPFPVDQAVEISPFNQMNFNFNYTFKGESLFRGSKLGFSCTNLFDHQSIVGVSPATKATATASFVPNAGDLINTMAGRSVMVTLTAGFAPRR